MMDQNKTRPRWESMPSATQIDLRGMEFHTPSGLHNIGSHIFLPYEINKIICVSGWLLLPSSLQFKILHIFCVLTYLCSKQGSKRTDAISAEAKAQERVETGIMDVSLEIM